MYNYIYVHTQKANKIAVGRKTGYLGDKDMKETFHYILFYTLNLQ